MSEGLLPVQRLSIDADVLMNLVATGQISEILGTLGLLPLVSPAVEGEVLYLSADRPDDPPSPIDVGALIDASTLERAVVTADEMALYVALAAEVDDGEAQAIALAASRGLPLASDDRRATRAATLRGIQVLSTPELLARWERVVGSPDRVGQFLRLVERRSHFRPSRRHELSSWWEDRARTAVEQPH